MEESLNGLERIEKGTFWGTFWKLMDMVLRLAAHCASVSQSASGAQPTETRRHAYQYDKSSKWLIEHHGDSILRLAGMCGFTAWKPLPAELVPTRQTRNGAHGT